MGDGFDWRGTRYLFRMLALIPVLIKRHVRVKYQPLLTRCARINHRK